MKNKQLIEEIEKNKQNNIYYKNNPEMFNQLLQLIKNHPISYGMKFKHLSNIQPLKDWINQMLPLLNDVSYHMSTKICWIFNGYVDFPKCKTCGKYVGLQKNISMWRGYPEHCSIQCRNNDPIILAKQIKTLKRHFNEDPQYFKKLEQKKKQTKIKNGHAPNWTNSKKAKETIAKNPNHWKERNVKTKETKLKLHGNPNYINVDAIAQTIMKQYGVKSYTQTEEYRIKTIQKSRQKYGCDSPNQSDIVKQHKIEGSMKKYGVSHPMKADIVKQHLSKTTYDNYGVVWPSQIPHIQSKMHRKFYYNDMWFDSSVELSFYIWLMDNCLLFEAHPNQAFTYTYNGIEHSYFPDFKICDIYYEIKGDHFFKKDGTMQNPYDHSQDELYEAKHQCMLKNNVIILKSSECSIFENYIKNVYGKDYIKQFKKVNKKI